MLPPDVAKLVEALGPERVERIHEPSLGLTAYLVIDSTALGPAAGGVRTAHYASEVDAVADACRLARTMTYKCALGGVDAGGGKAVVMATDALRRQEAFEELGRRVNDLQGDFRTAGDLGTTEEDLRAMARHTRYVHTDTANLAAAVARGVLRCAEACADAKGRPGLSGLRVAVQGAGEIGAAVAEHLEGAGAEVLIADVREERARAVAARIGATVVSPDDLLSERVDLLAPCAIGDVLRVDNIQGVRAWGLCGAANHICADDATHAAIFARGIVHVPDLISSAGAVIEGIGRTVMGIEDRNALIDTLRETAALVLRDARREGTPPIVHALRRAKARLANAR